MVSLWLLNLEGLVEDAVSYIELGHFREGDIAAVSKEQRDDICIGIKASALLGDVVCDDHIGALARELSAGVVSDVTSLCGESDEDAGAMLAPELGEDIGRRF